jgi:hypothetical protein
VKWVIGRANSTARPKTSTNAKPRSTAGLSAGPAAVKRDSTKKEAISNKGNSVKPLSKEKLNNKLSSNGQ